MTLSLMEARNAVINHYMDTRNYTRKQAEDYIHDDERVFWLLEEVQKEVELSKRVGKRIHFIAEDGGKEYNVRIRFRNELADAVIDQFGKDIQMFAVDAEHFTITAPIEVSPTFFAWIATFGRRVKILSPEPVVEKMRDFLQRSLDMYKDDGEM